MLLRSFSQLETDVIRHRENLVKQRLREFSLATTEFLCDQMQDCVDVLASSITENIGLDGKQATSSMKTGCAAMFTELVESIAVSAQDAILAQISAQTKMTFARAADFLLTQTAARLQRSLIGGTEGRETWRDSMAVLRSHLQPCSHFSLVFRSHSC